MAHPRSDPREGGFTLLELLIVVAITVVVAAIAIPNIINGIAQFRLRGAASSLSNLLQKDRMMAVSQNKYYVVLTGTGGVSAWVKLDTNTQLDDAEKINSLQLPRGVVLASSGAPSFPISNLASSGTLVAPTPPIIGGFTARGLPCLSSGTACTPNSNYYICYLRQDRSIGATGWAAVTVTPAGRVRVWMWNGSAWQ